MNSISLKLSFLLSFIFFGTLNTITSQVIESYQSSIGGVSVDIEILSVDPDEGFDNSLYFGFFNGVDGLYAFGFSSYKPKVYYANLVVGDLKSYSFDGNIFFHSTTKEVVQSQSLKAGRNIRYLFSRPIQKRKSYGLHLGFFNFNQPNNTIPTPNHITKGVVGGFTFLRAKHMHLNIFDDYKERRGTLISRVNLDFVYYFDQSFFSDDNYSEEDIKSELRQIGYRLYLDGKLGIWGRKGRVSFQYLLGASLSSSRNQKFTPIFGMGFGYNFNFSKKKYKPVKPRTD